MRFATNCCLQLTGENIIGLYLFVSDTAKTAITKRWTTEKETQQVGKMISLIYYLSLKLCFRITHSRQQQRRYPINVPAFSTSIIMCFNSSTATISICLISSTLSCLYSPSIKSLALKT